VNTRAVGLPASRPSTVAAVIDAMSVSGPARQLAAVARYLATQGIEIHVVTFRRRGRPAAPFVDFMRSSGVPVTVLPDSGPLDVRLVRRLHHALREIEPVVVQTHGYRPTALAYALKRFGATWPWLAFFHGATFENRKVRFYNWLDRQLMPSADKLVVMSEAQRDTFATMGSRVTVVHNAAIPVVDDVEAVSRSNAALAECRRSRPVIGMVGRLSPEKGVDVFLEAVATLVRRGVEFSAILVGDGPERSRLEAQRSALGLEERVHFVGALDAVGPVYDALDLLVIASLSEGLPNVLLEALRVGVPVVATSVGAIPEVIGHSRAAVLIPPGSAAALADGIVKAISERDDPAARRDRWAAAERMSLEARGNILARLYAELMAPRQANASALDVNRATQFAGSGR
jgi:glycosyltransferase involved in cell wall biosynthesis